MKFTFGIITNGQEKDRVQQICADIRLLNMPDDAYEIIVVGGQSLLGIKNCRVISFDETVKAKPWITRKKNIIFEQAKYENISIGHDYFSYDLNWFEGFQKFGEDWDCAMVRIKNIEGKRWRDWVEWPVKWADYNSTDIKNMYVSGGYYCIKKAFALKYPLDDNLCWCDGEDVKWSLQLRNFWTYKMNIYSTVHLLKAKNDGSHPLKTPEFNWRESYEF